MNSNILMHDFDFLSLFLHKLQKFFHIIDIAPGFCGYLICHLFNLPIAPSKCAIAIFNSIVSEAYLFYIEHDRYSELEFFCYFLDS